MLQLIKGAEGTLRKNQKLNFWGLPDRLMDFRQAGFNECC